MGETPTSLLGKALFPSETSPADSITQEHDFQRVVDPLWRQWTDMLSRTEAPKVPQQTGGMAVCEFGLHDIRCVRSCAQDVFDRPNRSTEDAITLTLHTALSHLDQRDTYVRMLFIDYSSAFNTIVPSKLVTKLRDLGLNSALCDWILNFLTGRPQAVRMGSTTSSTLTLNTGAPQGCVLSPLLYSLFTHDCVATHSSNTIVIKFADNTTVIGLITGDDETAYREEVRALTSWCQDNNLHLNVSKTKELIVDFRRRQREEHAPLSINGTTVERVNSFRFLGVHISEDLTWTHHTDFITKSARQRLFFLRRLRRLNMDSRIFCSFYRCTIESILTGCITAWYSSCTALNRKALQRVVKAAQHITRTELPSMEDLYTQRCRKKATKIIKDPSHPATNCSACCRLADGSLAWWGHDLCLCCGEKVEWPRAPYEDF
ncbi:hypothetical protein L3Q82_004570 [Scortum barcoo]|uniref:Uncharacterized protein n=1 Tax=Scortum barcoo TaxID=214431 RepID=A0ACB8VGK1_9TELE|nr:hypothetical protein L3Q82_004570 [Scortum barcoo]